MNRVSRTVSANVRAFRTKIDLTRKEFVQAINRQNPTSQWTTSRLANVEHAKGNDRAITIDEIYDVCKSFDVTAFELTVPDDDPSWSHQLRFEFYGVDTPDTNWIETLKKTADFRSRLWWHPDVVDHTLPFWAVADYAADQRVSLAGDDDFDQDLLVRMEHGTANDLIQAQERIVKLKVKEWNLNNWPTPSDHTVHQWVTRARVKREAARVEHYQRISHGKFKTTVEEPQCEHTQEDN